LLNRGQKTLAKEARQMSVAANSEPRMLKREHAVVIAGGGPTGLMLAGELALAGVDVAIVERRESQALAGLRPGGLYPRAIEVLDQRGIADRFVSQGTKAYGAPFAHLSLNIGDLPTRHNYYLVLWQTRIEAIMLGWVSELGVPIYRGREVTGFAKDDAGVDVELSGSPSVRAQYLVGCDGGRSVIRKLAGIEFPGWDATTRYLIAEIETAEEPEWGVRRTEKGINAIAKLDDGNRARIVLSEKWNDELKQQWDEKNSGQRGEPALHEVREALIAVYGKDFALRSAESISRFTDMTRQAARYRNRRVFLAGDAAHVHSPKGGQGLNLGIQDSVNLGWKLAQVIRGTSPDSLLDTYHAERHPVGARVLRNTMALTAIERSEDRVDALREMMCELFLLDEPRRQYLAMMSGLDVRYDFGEGHPLLGCRMPDLDLLTADGPRRVFTLLHKARPVLLNFGEPGSFDIFPWADRLQVIGAKCEGAWQLPTIGQVTAPAAVLVRPDGYVVWVGDATKQSSLTDLTVALTKWFGSPATA
jgi:2-polyprenyl-6-methoxyphenol hydroxylase-like FAD-dependent oxidoreductase